MSEGLRTTFELLAKTANEAAVNALVPALESPHQQIQEEALRVILKRRSPAGGREVISRLHTNGDQWREIINEQRGRLATAMRKAVLGSDQQLCTNACQAILWFGEYDLMPSLISAAEDATNPNADRVAETIVELADLLYQELAAPRDYRERRDPHLVRQHVVSSLELSVKRFSDHKRTEILEASLLLMNRDNTVLKQILKDPHDGAYRAVVETLTHSSRPGVMRLILSYLDDSNAPAATIKVLAHRDDAKFLRHLLKKIGYEPSATAAKNLKKIERFFWLMGSMPILEELDDEAQFGAVQMVVASGMKRLEVFELIQHMLKHGKPGGRRAAIAALQDYSGGDANTLAVNAVEDSDPEVQACALEQLRQRGVPGGMSRLIEAIESPHEVVREAVRSSLSEFSFERFLGAFDMLDDEVKQSTGLLVKKIDPGTVPGLASEMQASSRTKRLRAIEIATVIGAAPELEEYLLELMEDDDHMVRVQVVKALRQCNTQPACQVLKNALTDRSVGVQEAAQDSLRHLGIGSNQ